MPFGYGPAAGRMDARSEGSPRLDVARFGRGTDPIVRLSRAGDGSQAARPVDRVFAGAAAVPARRARPAAHCATGFAYRQLDARERDLCRPLLVRRQGGGVRRAFAVRGEGAVRRLVGGAARLQLAAPSARRRIPASPAPMHARWSRNGSRCKARATPPPSSPRSPRAGSSPGSVRHRWCSTIRTCASTGASCAA